MLKTLLKPRGKKHGCRRVIYVLSCFIKYM